MAKDKLQMNFDLSGMAAYAKSNGQELMVDLIEQSDLFSGSNGIRVITGVKSSDKFADITDDFTYIQLTNNDPSTISPSGGTALSDITVNVIGLGVKEKYTEGQLVSKIAQLQLQPGSDPSNNLPYADIFVSFKGSKIAKENELEVWQGNNTGSTHTKFNGFVKQIKDSTAPTSAASGMTASNAISYMEAVLVNIKTEFPIWIECGAHIYMSPAQFDTYYRALFGLGGVIDKNTVDGGVKKSFMIPGSNYTVHSTLGLSGLNNIVATIENNLCVITDLVSEDDQVKFEYLTELEYWRLSCYYKLGAKVSKPTKAFITI